MGNVFDASRPAYLARSSSLNCWSHSCTELPIPGLERTDHCAQPAPLLPGRCWWSVHSARCILIICQIRKKPFVAAGAAVGWRASHPAVITAPLGGQGFSAQHQHSVGSRAGETTETISLSLWHYNRPALVFRDLQINGIFSGQAKLQWGGRQLE